jgi:RHS repeat-associated protein
VRDRNQSFTYDSVNRIARGQSSGTHWGETFTIDAWGNLTNETGIAGKTSHEGLNTSAGTNNQLSGFGYDAAGNMTSNGSASYVYDAENRLVWTSGYRYLYDGDGDRVEKCVAATSATACPTSGTNGTLYWRNLASETLDESDLSGNMLEEYNYFNGQRVARRDVSTNAVHFYFSDHLGSHGVVENATGSACEQDIDYYPYGGVQNDYCPNVPQNYKFTGKERDSESGLDYFGARHHASSLGRFMTVDPSGLSIDGFNPQSWNRYTYVLNNPLRLVDRNGKWPTETHNQIIDAAFPGLSVGQRSELKRISAWVDRIPGGQTKAHNHEHAMKSPGEDPTAAKHAIDQNIQNHEQAAQRAQGGTPLHASEINNAALDEFGQALHPVTDRTSPAHTDANGNPRDWNGLPTWPSEVSAMKEHNAEEATYTSEQFETAVVAAQQAFKNTFGDAAFQDATTIPGDGDMADELLQDCDATKSCDPMEPHDQDNPTPEKN